MVLKNADTILINNSWLGVNSSNDALTFNNEFETLNAIYGLTADSNLIVIKDTKCNCESMPVISAPMKSPAIASRLNSNMATRRNPAGMKTQLIKLDISRVEKTKSFKWNSNTQAMETMAITIKWNLKNSLTWIKIPLRNLVLNFLDVPLQ